MTTHSRWTSIACIAAATLVFSACSSGSDTVTLGEGVTEEPCPDAVNPDNGCIYLAVLSDLTVGPFAAFGNPLLEGQRAFWNRVNEDGGIGGAFDVNIDEHVRDTEYNPEKHVAAYTEITTEVLAIAESLGTPPTLAILPRMIDDEVVGGVSTWWSGWEFEENVLNTGSNYCIDAMNGLDWAKAEYGAESVLPISFPGDYGGDGLAGVQKGAEALGMTVQTPVTQIPKVAGGETSAAVAAILAGTPDVVFLTVGPTEAAEIVGGAAARGYTGRFIGNHPSYNQAILASAAGDAFAALYHVVGPHENWGGTSEGHEAMRASLDGKSPDNDGFTFGWVLSYPMKAALEQAYDDGELNRAGLLAAVGNMTVDFEGMLPDKQYGDANESVVRQTTISRPDKAALADRLGLTVVEKAYAGETAAAFEFTGPCFEIG